MQAIIDACKAGLLDATPVLVISNNSNSGAADKALKENIPFLHLSITTHPDVDELDAAITDAIIKSMADLVILAGYMKKIGPRLLKAYSGRILNIHPALLPKFGGEGMFGMNVHKAVIEAGESESGCTVHTIDKEYDRGKILSQTKVPVLPEDTPEILAARILEKEHQLYWQTIKAIARGEMKL